jgi:hypothetical protein
MVAYSIYWYMYARILVLYVQYRYVRILYVQHKYARILYVQYWYFTGTVRHTSALDAAAPPFQPLTDPPLAPCVLCRIAVTINCVVSLSSCPVLCRCHHQLCCIAITASCVV